MQTARRLYVYLLTGISLGVLVAALAMLGSLLFESLGLGPSGDELFDGGDAVRERLTLATAMTAVALPLWLAHWAAAERSVRPDRPGASTERTSDVRGLYFALALGILLLMMATSLASIVRDLVIGASGTDAVGTDGIGGDLAAFLVSGSAWGYHVAIRSRDWARGPMTGGGAVLPRAYLYGATLIGLWLTLTGVTGLVELGGRALLGGEPDLIGRGREDWWAYPLAEALAGIVAGGAIWLGHALYARNLLADPGWRGEEERPARLRLAYFVAAIVVTAAATTFLVADGIRQALLAAFGASEASGAPVLGLVLLPLLSALAFGATWYLHARWMSDEAARLRIPGRVGAADRLRRHAELTVGLAFGAVGLAWLLGLLLDALTGAGRVLSGAESYLEELARLLPFVLLGLVLWASRWSVASRRRNQDPETEGGSTTRRATLLLILAVSLLAGVGSLGFILYRVFGAAFGVTSSGDASGELARAVGALVVAACVAAYHGMELRRDQRDGGSRIVPERPALTLSAVVRVTGPSGTTRSTILDVLRSRLPEGYVVELLDGPPSPADGR